VNAGLFGYNGALVGASFSFFLPLQDAVGQFLVPSPSLVAAAVLGGAASSAACVSIGRSVTIPQFTLSFNLIALSVFASARPLLKAAGESGELATEASGLVSPTMMEWVLAPLTGVSQITFVDSPLAGLAVLSAMLVGNGIRTRGDLSAGAVSAAAALTGSAVGALTAFCIGEDPEAIVSGLHGYNAALTSLAVATFFKPNAHSAALAVGGAAATSVMAAGVMTAWGASLGIPALTVPFCVVAPMCIMLASPAVPRLRLKG